MHHRSAAQQRQGDATAVVVFIVCAVTSRKSFSSQVCFKVFATLLKTMSKRPDRPDRAEGSRNVPKKLKSALRQYAQQADTKEVPDTSQ